ncbi:Hydroxyacylglutathione_hydrolase [Hexamita inflata]|uniref:Hydroxyacylglutathione hydrolase n=1 Tax=Hexamita inflata TaxID=28002 RepID=A0AA86N6Z7_9EUKA|nr:Hydroxyacylglutathione hydrolase [Hexamita inflata]
MPFEIRTFPTGSLQANCFLLIDKATNNAALIDPGDRSEKIQNMISIQDINVTHILITHAHFDHMFGCGFFKSLYPSAKLLVHQNDVPIWAGNVKFAQMFGIKAPKDYINQPEGTFKDGEVIQIGSSNVEVVLTPGHTPGSVCFIDKEGKIAVTGDTLFGQGIGRTDFPGGSAEQMRDSIVKLKKILGTDYIIYPGHGGSEKSGRAIKGAEMMI